MEYPFTLFAFYAVALPAVIILGVGKGGFAGIGMISLPIMALVVPPLQAASILLPILLVQDALSTWLYRRSWDARNLMILLPGAAFGILMGYLLAAKVSESMVALTVGMISVWFGIRQTLILFRPTTAGASRPGILLGLLCGTCAGFTSMIAHAGAPPFQIYAIPQRLLREIFIGTSVIFFTVMNWMKLLPFLALGQLNWSNLILAITLIPIATASTWLGVYLVRRSSGRAFYVVIYSLMILLGLYLIIDSIRHQIGAMY
jgi:uncharacterized membrane protein YfcA